MRRWLLVTKEVECWKKLHDEDEIKFSSNIPLKSGDNVFIYKASPHTCISHIFQVKKNISKKKGKYEIYLNRKKCIPNPVKLSELKAKNSLRNWKKSFKKPLHKVPLCIWSEIVGIIKDKNPDIFEHYTPKFCSGPNKEGYPLELKDDLITFIINIQSYTRTYFNEESTKYLIVLPLLEKLGWNIYNPREVFPENQVDERRVDYILQDYKSNITCIEVKTASKEFFDDEKNKKQLRWYCSSKNVVF